jgi:hypothetical protein
VRGFGRNDNEAFQQSKIVSKLLKLTDFIVRLSRKAKHLAVAEEKTICSMTRFFASLRFAQNDKLLCSLTNKGLIITDVIVSVSLS